MTAAGSRYHSRRVVASVVFEGNHPGLVYLSTVGAIGGLVAYNYALRHLPVIVRLSLCLHQPGHRRDAGRPPAARVIRLAHGCGRVAGVRRRRRRPMERTHADGRAEPRGAGESRAGAVELAP